MLLGILLAVLMVVCVALIGVILLQRSEGGAFGMSGGGPGAFMTARGTGDLLTRTTEILVAVFFGLCLLMTIISSRERAASALVEKMKGLPTVSATPPAPAAVNRAPSAAPALPLGVPRPAAPNLGAPTTGGINLLGGAPLGRSALPAPRLAPVAGQPPAAQTARTARTARSARAQPPKGQPPASSAATAPIVAPPPVVLPPPPAPANQ